MVRTAGCTMLLSRKFILRKKPAASLVLAGFRKRTTAPVRAAAGKCGVLDQRGAPPGLLPTQGPPAASSPPSPSESSNSPKKKAASPLGLPTGAAPSAPRSRTVAPRASRITSCFLVKLLATILWVIVDVYSWLMSSSTPVKRPACPISLRSSSSAVGRSPNSIVSFPFFPFFLFFLFFLFAFSGSTGATACAAAPLHGACPNTVPWPLEAAGPLHVSAPPRSTAISWSGSSTVRT
mmetsp:Transcript_38091/g.103888  ORF Transcript_38091/g.103888 Transcript_38091/m.103888 type:complete len:236 (-) Transcript_38091:586-1293(-)